MGQAKNRGNRDQRIAEAMRLQELTIEELRADLKLTPTAEYLGYAIHLEKTDEFLADYSDTAAMVRKVWAKTPELALPLQSFAKAVEISRECRGSVIVVLFDIGTQIVVSPITGLRAVK